MLNIPVSKKNATFYFTLLGSPVMSPQSGSRFKLCCLTIPCRTSCAGVVGWNKAVVGLHSEPCSLTTTIRLHSGTALSRNTYFPGSMNTCANLIRQIAWRSDADLCWKLDVIYLSSFTCWNLAVCVWRDALNVWRPQNPNQGYCWTGGPSGTLGSDCGGGLNW